MPGYGFRYGFSKNRRRFATAFRTISPGGAFNGTPGSGYSGAPPTRTGLKTPMQPYYGHMGSPTLDGTGNGLIGGTAAPSGQFVFTDKFLPDWIVPSDGIIAVDAHSPGDDAVVTLHVEGNTIVLNPADRVLIDVPQRTGPSTWSTVKKPVYAARLTGITGSAIEIYATISSARAGYSSRVIGPIRLHNITAATCTLTIDPGQAPIAGQRYQTPQAALLYASTNTTDPWIKIIGAAPFTIDANTSFGTSASASNNRRGVIELDGTVQAITCLRTTKGSFRPGVNNLIFRNCVWDCTNIDQIYTESGGNVGNSDNYRPQWLLNCEIYSAGAGEIYNNQTTRPAAMLRYGVAMIGCYLHDLQGADMIGVYRSGNLYRRIAGDIFHINGWSSIIAEGGPSYAGHNIAEDCSADPQRTGINAWAVRYTGAGVATLEISGSHNSASRQVVAKVNGGTVGTFTASATVGSGNYLVSDFVAAANAALNGTNWTFTTLDNTRRFAASGNETGTQIVAVSTSDVNVTTHFWLHMDGYQFSAVYQHDNSLVCNNRFIASEVQIFPSVQSATRSAWNCGIWNNASNQPPAGDQLEAQLTGTWRFSFMRHNSHPQQQGLFRYEAGNLLNCEDMDVSNNVFEQIVQSGTPGGSNRPTFVNNHGYNGGDLTGGTGTTSGGTAAADFPNLASPTYTIADYTPAVGATLRSNLKTPTFSWDINGTLRAGTALLGAVA
jgi:hypothetical protein